MSITPEKALMSELSPYKNWRTKWNMPIGVVFPNTYSVGMSNLGFQSVYRLLAEEDFAKPMRFFIDMESSPEGDLSLDQCSVIFFSIPFELDYLTSLKMLLRAGIPLTPEDRDEDTPVIIAGGAAVTLNPNIPKGIFDIVYMGDLFPNMPKIMENLRKFSLDNDRAAFIEEMQKLPGTETPVRCSNRPPAFSPIVSSLASFRNMFLVEAQRSCPFRCGFCATPYIYGDLHNYTKEEIIGTINEHNPGTDRIGLVGSSVAEHPELEDIFETLLKMEIYIGLSSVRMDRITDNMLGLLAKSGTRSITIAPETHVEHLYKKIGKHITADSIIEKIGEMPFRDIKLYYIIGLPEETMDDVEFLLNEIERISKSLPDCRFSVSLNPFIPKPGTRLGKFGMESDKSLNQKFKLIQKKIGKKGNLKLTINYSYRQRLEAVIANASPNITEALIRAANGFPIKRALKDLGIDIKKAIIPENI